MLRLTRMLWQDDPSAAPGNQIIVNERKSGSMLKADVEIPVLAGDVPGLLKRI